MKRCIFSIFASGALAATAFAQLYNVEGNTGVKAGFNFTIDDAANTVTVFIDNTIAGVNGANGTITSFGFNTPFASADLSSVSFTQDFGDPWNVFMPYSLSPTDTFEQGLGVGSGKTEEGGFPQNGIAFGSTATFVFTLPDFEGTDAIAGWLGEGGLTVRFQQVIDSEGVSGGSDKVIGDPGDDGGGGGLGFVPEPSTYGLIGAMVLLGLAAVRKVGRHV